MNQLTKTDQEKQELVTTDKKEIQAPALQIDEAPKDLIQKAIESGADLEKLEKLLELQIKWEQNQAKKAYVKAMAQFKADPPKIEKDKKVNYNTQKGRTEYSHATLANVTEKINESLSKYGLSASWSTSQSPEGISVTCTITHELGYSENTTLTAPSDNTGYKNTIQAIGSTITYLERYTLLALTGLATFDVDDDARKSEDEPISSEQVKVIDSLVKQTNTDPVKFLAYMNVGVYNDISKSQFERAVKALRAKLPKEN